MDDNDAGLDGIERGAQLTPAKRVEREVQHETVTIRIVAETPRILFGKVMKPATANFTVGE